MGGASASLACVVDSGVTSQKMREREKEVYEEEGGRVEGGGVRGGRVGREEEEVYEEEGEEWKEEVYEEEAGRVEGGGRREGRRMGNDGEERRRGEEELTSALQRA